MEATHVTQTQLINQILRIGHGKLEIYEDVGMKGVIHEPELYAHLIAWNSKHGEVRDSKVALPVIGLRTSHADLLENAAAHLCLLSPRDLVRATRFHRALRAKPNGGGAYMKRAVELYLRKREASIPWFDRTALQHRKSLKTLYAMNHIKPSDRANRILFQRDYPARSVYQRLRELKNMAPNEAAGTILNYKIPFLTAVGALGGIKDKPDVILALIEGMTPAELVNNANALRSWGVFASPVLSAAYDAGLQKKKKVSTLKAGAAAKAVTDKKLVKKLKKVQEDQIDRSKGIEGDWLVLGDRSGSMHTALDLSREIASFLARTVKGNVHLVLFNTSPAYFDVTGKNYDDIYEETRRYDATGGTAIGCGLDLIREKGIAVNGIAICSDGGDNTMPLFSTAYERYVRQMGTEPTVYLWHVPGEQNKMVPLCERAGIQVTTFELGRDVDYYSIPQLALTMRTGRYSLVEEIMESKLLTFADVFKGGTP